MKKYLFVSDIHGRNTKLEAELSQIAKENPPEIVFFLGDTVGTELLDQLQKLFYNSIYNHIKKLMTTNNRPTKKEVLSFPTENGKTLADGITELQVFLKNICPSITTPTNTVNYIFEISRYLHFGHFVSNLPKKIRNILRQDLEKNAEIWADIMTQFTNQGSLVVIVEGNWDARTPLDFCRSKNRCAPIPVEKRIFYFKDFLKSLNDKILYFDEPSTIETQNEMFVILPFDSCINLNLPEKIETNKKIILVSHAQIDWHAIKGDTPMTSEGQKIQKNMKKIIEDLHPNYAIHGHLHDQGLDYFFNNTDVKYLPIGSCRFIDF
ncbi:MAG: metallophosphoesterase [Candidatus Shapirobacteria bacterium]|jgi:Icc-related predicted phosphoesterase